MKTPPPEDYDDEDDDEDLDDTPAPVDVAQARRSGMLAMKISFCLILAGGLLYMTADGRLLFSILGAVNLGVGALCFTAALWNLLRLKRE